MEPGCLLPLLLAGLWHPFSSQVRIAALGIPSAILCRGCSTITATSILDVAWFLHQIHASYSSCWVLFLDVLGFSGFWRPRFFSSVNFASHDDQPMLMDSSMLALDGLEHKMKSTLSTRIPYNTGIMRSFINTKRDTIILLKLTKCTYS